MRNGKRTKAQIVERISETIPLTRSDIHRIVDMFLDEVKAGLGEDKVLELRGFGTFELRTRKKRESARNPRTGENVQVGAHGVVVFRPGRELKEAAWTLRKT